MQDKAIYDLWPTRAERDEWKRKFEGSTPSDVRSEEARIYWDLKLLDAIVEYHVALNALKVDAEHFSASSVTPAAGVVPIVMRPSPPCKISSGPAVSGSGMPVTINLCRDTQGSSATAVQLVAVNVYDISGKEVSAQPTSLKPSSFVLTLQPGTYDINSTIGPTPGVGFTSKASVFLYESCANAGLQLCAFITAVGPGSSFSLKVI
jgi:hypothetical protein